MYILFTCYGRNKIFPVAWSVYGTLESFKLHRRVRDACSNFIDKITENQSKKQKRYDSKTKEDFRNLFCYLTSTCCF